MMNERIKLLAEQCGFKSNPNIYDRNQSFDIPKFAQLIIWEAIGLCKVDVDALTGPFLSEYEKGIVEGYRRANENLRGYFGVEK
jgi:hypothetical protein